MGSKSNTTHRQAPLYKLGFLVYVFSNMKRDSAIIICFLYLFWKKKTQRSSGSPTFAKKDTPTFSPSDWLNWDAHKAYICIG